MADPVPVQTDASGEKKPGSGQKTMWVVSTRDDDRVALWEVNGPGVEHPGGEAYVAGKVPEEVAVTPDVALKLRNSELREATAEEITKRKAQLGVLGSSAVKGPWD